MARFLMVVLVLMVALTVGAVPAGAQPRVQARPPAPPDRPNMGRLADFNGDGHTDAAVGAPGEDVGAIVDAGTANSFSNRLIGREMVALIQAVRLFAPRSVVLSIEDRDPVESVSPSGRHSAEAPP